MSYFLRPYGMSAFGDAAIDTRTSLPAHTIVSGFSGFALRSSSACQYLLATLFLSPWIVSSAVKPPDALSVHVPKSSGTSFFGGGGGSAGFSGGGGGGTYLLLALHATRTNNAQTTAARMSRLYWFVGQSRCDRWQLGERVLVQRFLEAILRGDGTGGHGPLDGPVHRLHAIGEARLHEARDLLWLRVTDEARERETGEQNLMDRDAADTVGTADELLRDDSGERLGEQAANLRLLIRGERVDVTVDRRRSRVRVHAGEHQDAEAGELERGLHRLGI